MEPKFQSSFIPKRPVVDSPKMLGPVTKNRNIFSILATIMFIITLFAVGGAFGYRKYVESQIAADDKKLSEARSAFEESKIQNLLIASARLNSIKILLENHYVISEVLVMLQNLTIKNMRFDSLSYQNFAGRATLSMDSEAISYNAVASQRDIFVDSGLLADVAFSAFSLSDRGYVRSKMTATVLPKLISYKDYINSQNIQQ